MRNACTMRPDLKLPNTPSALPRANMWWYLWHQFSSYWWMKFEASSLVLVVRRLEARLDYLSTLQRKASSDFVAFLIYIPVRSYQLKNERSDWRWLAWSAFSMWEVLECNYRLVLQRQCIQWQSSWDLAHDAYLAICRRGPWRIAARGWQPMSHER